MEAKVMDKPIILRKALRSDIAVLSSMAHDLNMYHGFDIKPAEKKLEQDWDDIECLVCELDSKIVAFLAGYPIYEFHDAKKGYEIQNLFVEKTTRGLGIGKKFLQEVIKEKVSNGAAIFRLTILKSNPEAINFYRSCCFELKDANFIFFGKLEGSKLIKFISESV